MDLAAAKKLWTAGRAGQGRAMRQRFASAEREENRPFHVGEIADSCSCHVLRQQPRPV